MLGGLSAEQAFAKPHGLPHSIAGIVSHMCYWQEWFNNGAVGKFTAPAAHAPEGWPAGSSDDWEALRARFFAAVEEAKRIARESDSLDQPLLPPGVDIPPIARDSRGSGIMHAALHTGHHLGQIIVMRRLLGTWPPPAGSMTW